MKRHVAGALLTLLCIPGTSLAQEKKPSTSQGSRDNAATAQSCVPKGSQKACEITIDRLNPASPDKIVVPAGTAVTIRLTNARINEAVAFTPKTAQTPPPNVGETFLKSIIEPLKSTNFVKSEVPPPPPPPEAHAGQHTDKTKDPIAAALEVAEDELDEAFKRANDAAVYLSCLQAYEGVTGKRGALYCDPSYLLDDGSFEWARSLTLSAMSEAASAPLPLATLQDVDKRLKATIDNDLTDANDTTRAEKLKKDDGYLARLDILSTAVDDAKKAQAALLAAAARLRAMPSLPQEPTFTISEPKNYSSSIDVAAQEVMSGTKTSLATVAIEWQSNPWVISTGIMFSTLENRTFTNAALFVNGIPQVNDDGKNLTVVQESVSRPAVLFPVVMVHYKMPFYPPLMASGGIGLNLGTTTAEFVAGPSIKVLGIVFTVGAHFGRETDLTQGVKVGDKLGADPPPLPTETNWTPHFRWGVAISYAIPFS